MSTHEQDETLAGGRQRRSAAAKNKAWSTLMGPGGGKHKGDEIDEEQQDTSSKLQTSMLHVILSLL